MIETDTAAEIAHAKSACDAWHHLGRRSRGRQVDEDRPIGERRSERLSHGQREASLSAATRTDECDQPNVPAEQQVTDALRLLLPPNQRRRLGRKRRLPEPDLHRPDCCTRTLARTPTQRSALTRLDRRTTRD